MTNKQTHISIYNAIVRPYFDYCCEVWDVFGETQSKQIQKVHIMAPIIFSYKGEKTDYQCETYKKSLYFQNMELTIRKRPLCITEQNFEILFIKTSG